MQNLPDDFLIRAKEFAGSEYEQFISSLDQPVPVSIRSNPFKNDDQFDTNEKIEWSINGRFLNERPSFTLDPLFHAGCYYVQDASSQFLEVPFLQAKKILDRAVRVLDLCAAPGGKSTHILSMLNGGDVLVSNEIIPSRNNILRQNITKWGCANVFVTQNDTSQLSQLRNLFDIIVVDAPCSGEGLFRKDKDAIEEWSIDNVNRCSVRQNEILDHAYSMLKSDGILIYSTCTFEKSENDEQVSRLEREFGIEIIPVDFQNENIVRTEYGLAFFPHRVKGEGFYISMLRKKSAESDTAVRTIKNSEHVKFPVQEYLKEPDSFTLFKKDENLFAILNQHFDLFNYIKSKTYLRLAGIPLGEIKGKDFVPSESLALSNYVSEKISSIELSKEEALNFLRGNAIPVNGNDGLNLIRHKNFNLGWIKKMGNRVNNYYPKEWRIRMK
jgi:16S rRNA C967 or C1407 C5-methylase (RsmB/RsmF family)/NOL1/NOP2/fmu family ribosome biogenesis protein